MKLDWAFRRNRKYVAFGIGLDYDWWCRPHLFTFDIGLVFWSFCFTIGGSDADNS